MANIPKLLTDGAASLELGIDYGQPPHLLPVNQASFAVNTTFRGGQPTPRPGWYRHLLTQPSNEVLSLFGSGRYQGATFFRSFQGVPMLVTSISGRLFTINLNDFKVAEITHEPTSQYEEKVWFCVGEGFVFRQDGLSGCTIFNGSESRAADTRSNEVPGGTVMAYHQGRLWVARGRNFWASDLAGNSSGTPTYAYKDAILKFTENTYLNEGGSFTVPGDGDITAMKSIAQINTALGTSDLAVFTSDGVFLVNVPLDRTAWKDLTSPVQRYGQLGNGALHEGVVTCNSDLWYRADDGIRSLIMAVRYFDDWANVPMSGELDPILAQDTQSLLRFGSGVNFDNRLLMTTSPYRTPQGIVHRGLTVLDFNIVSRMRNRLPPAWEGIWTGLKVFQILRTRVDNVLRCFVFALGDTGIELWELSRNNRRDFDGVSEQPICWYTEFRRMNFNSPQDFKQLEDATVWVDQLDDRAYFTAEYRSDRSLCWQPWHRWSEGAVTKDCSTVQDGCTLDGDLQEQERPNMQLPQPPDDCNPINGRPYRTGYEFQARLSGLGYFRLNKFTMNAAPLGDEMRPESACLGDADAKLLLCCPKDPYECQVGSDGYDRVQANTTPEPTTIPPTPPTLAPTPIIGGDPLRDYVPPPVTGGSVPDMPPNPPAPEPPPPQILIVPNFIPVTTPPVWTPPGSQGRPTITPPAGYSVTYIRSDYWFLPSVNGLPTGNYLTGAQELLYQEILNAPEAVNAGLDQVFTWAALECWWEIENNMLAPLSAEKKIDSDDYAGIPHIPHVPLSYDIDIPGMWNGAFTLCTCFFIKLV